MYGRKAATPQTQVRVGVGVVIRDHEGRILFEKRSDSRMWAIPGGGVEPGESVKEAALREIREETGLTVEITRLVGVYSGPEDRIVTYPSNGDVIQHVDIILEGVPVSGTLTPSHESETLQYFDPNQLPSEVVPSTWAPLRDALEGNYGQLR